MLLNLHVKNLALIDETEVEFSKGLNILSGETGAGKSIIIGSINLALGEKAPKEMLRNTEENALVELIFHVENEDIIRKLRELDVEPEDGIVILSRKITSQRAIGRVNGEAVSVSKMKEIASLLIDIHGQHEHQSLLSRRKHLEILDEFAKKEIGNQKEVVAQAYKEYKKIQEEWNNSNVGIEERKRELSFLEYEVQEIEEANLTVGEDELLEAEYKRFLNGKKIMEGVNSAYAITAGDMDNASELIGRAVRELSMVSKYDEQVATLENQIAEIDNLLNDFTHEISAYISNADFNEERFYEIEKRLDIMNHLKAKYGRTIELVLESYEEKVARIQVLNDYDHYLETLHEQYIASRNNLESECIKLSEIRKSQAAHLTKAIKNALDDLNFLDVVFEMKFDKTSDYTINGFDDPEFMISTNPGEEVKPLGKVASGGELSRIMLAIKTIMAENDEIEALIFDEIDSGISGRTAQMVAEKMNELSRSHQIICITHLPQIASMADTHFLIEKSVENNATHSQIHRLTEEQSVSELARMLGGVEITDTVLKNAVEMKKMAADKK